MNNIILDDNYLCQRENAMQISPHDHDKLNNYYLFRKGSGHHTTTNQQVQQSNYNMF